MQQIEVRGPTVEEAVKRVLTYSGKKRDEVKVTVLEEGKRGFLGIGAEEARVVVTIPNSESSNDELSKEEMAAIAKDVLEDLLDAMGIEAQVNVYNSPMHATRTENSACTLNISSEDAPVLIGRRGQTLETLEYVTRLIIGQRLKQWPGAVRVDVDGYRARRARSVRQLAAQTADWVRLSGEPTALDPMANWERKIVHQTLQNDPDVTTESKGKGSKRRVTVKPKKEKNA